MLMGRGSRRVLLSLLLTLACRGAATFTARSQGALEAEAGSCKGEAVMIRTYLPTEAMVKRFQRIIEEIEPERQVIISYGTLKDPKEANLLSVSEGLRHNSTEIIEEKPVFLDDLYKRFGKQRVVVTSDDMMLKNFPDMRNLPSYFTLMKRADGTEFGIQTWARGYHDEYIYTAMREYERVTGEKWNGCGLWVWEDDLEYTGNFKQLFDKYSGTADLISEQAHPLPKEKEHRLRWSSQKFRDEYVVDNKVHRHREHLTYQSRRFLDAWGNAMKRGVHAHSEFGTATFCAVKGFKQRNVDLDDMDDRTPRNGWFVTTRHLHSQEEMKAHVEQMRKQGKAVLIHPCKY
eukprot:jgi/Bigna1/79191/fgenesh1_pg.60_\